jgi:hypothetical protein
MYKPESESVPTIWRLSNNCKNVHHNSFFPFPSPSLAATNYPNNNWMHQEIKQEKIEREREREREMNLAIAGWSCG